MGELAAAEHLLPMPLDGLDKGPQRIISGAEEFATSEGKEMSGQVGGGGELGGDAGVVIVIIPTLPLIHVY